MKTASRRFGALFVALTLLFGIALPSQKAYAAPKDLGSYTIDLSGGSATIPGNNSKEQVGCSLFVDLASYQEKITMTYVDPTLRIDLDKDGSQDIIVNAEFTEIIVHKNNSVKDRITIKVDTGSTPYPLDDIGVYSQITFVFGSSTKDISKAAVTGLGTKTYTGSALTPAPVVKYSGKTLKKGTDYTVAYKNNINAGTATVTITGKGGYTGTLKKTFSIEPASLTKAKITGLTDKFHTGKAITQTPVVKLGTKTLKAGTDYTVTYKNNKNVGTATVTITGTGNYTGTAKATFKILDPVEEFVARLYRVCLDREPEAAGQAWWVARLKAKQETGGSCAWGFFDSTEFKNHNYGNAAFLDHAYLAFFDRKADAGGKNWWLGEMKKGVTRKQVILNGFAVSNEWKALCKSYGIRP